jgi:hypothetical protein
MKLLTKKILKSLPALYSQENVTDPNVMVKFFSPWSGWTWYVTEGSPVCGGCGNYGCAIPEHMKMPIQDFRFFGFVDGHEAELGYFTLSDLERIRGPLGLKIERDLYWKPTLLSEVPKSARGQ